MAKTLPKATKIMLVRHAEKPEKNSTCGVTQEGKQSKESLEVRGWQRAGALAHLFAPDNGDFQNIALARPQFLFASKPLKRKGSRRPMETITPLAEKLRLDINSKFQRNETEAMIEKVRSCKGVVLICWQQEYLPEIASHIVGNGKRVPEDWPEDRFDIVWVFDLDRASKKYRFKQVPQRLLAGDLKTQIK